VPVVADGEEAFADIVSMILTEAVRRGRWLRAALGRRRGFVGSSRQIS
jgi:hypothetical protein